jgi:hypothetical protein
MYSNIQSTIKSKDSIVSGRRSHNKQTYSGSNPVAVSGGMDQATLKDKLAHVNPKPSNSNRYKSGSITTSANTAQNSPARGGNTPAKRGNETGKAHGSNNQEFSSLVV